nr:nitrate regulatory gene2 protein [Ipomoea batatas]
MGCAQSRLDNEESVSRCKDRRNLMKQSVMVRNAFASAHSAYAMALKNTGAALNDYAQGEVPPPAQSPVVVSEPASEPPPPPPPHMMERTPLPPPPPPLPSFSPLPPLQRAMTMPEFSKSRGKMKSIAIDEEEEDEEEESGLKLRNQRNGAEKSGPVDNETPIKTPEPPPPPPAGVAWDYFFTVDNMPGTTLGDVEEEDEEEDEYIEENDGVQDSPRTPKFENAGGDEEFKTPEKGGIESEMEETPVTAKEKHFVHSNTAPPGIRGFMNGGKVNTANSADFYKVLGQIDDHFLKASQCAQEVSKMLEATRMHYHSNFADKENINHAERVMQIITWNKSLRGISNGNGAKDNYADDDESETHATVLDKLLAWEKKLYEELKAGEIIKHEYQRKIAILNKLKKRNASSESLEKVKAAVSHLHTRYIVEMQSLDSTVAEVNEIRDKQLYPKLAALVHGMAKMWESMCRHHEDQMRIVMALSSIDMSATPMETSKNHQSHTIQLADVIKEWHDQFENLVNNQKMYIQALNSWLKLNLIPVESSLREKPSSPLRVQNPPIQPLLHAWNELLEKLPDEHSRSAINSFEAVIRTIIIHQDEEVKLKEKCDETRKEYMRKRQAFEDWYHKYMQRRTPPDEIDPDRRTDANGKDPISERQFVVDSLQKRLDEETEAYQKHCIQVREKSLGTLKIQLPELFRAMRDYSHMSFNAYERLRLLVASQNSNQAS